MFIEILFQILLFKGGVLIYAEHCICCLHPNLSILRALETLYFYGFSSCMDLIYDIGDIRHTTLFF